MPAVLDGIEVHELAKVPWNEVAILPEQAWPIRDLLYLYIYKRKLPAGHCGISRARKIAPYLARSDGQSQSRILACPLN